MRDDAGGSRADSQYAPPGNAIGTRLALTQAQVDERQLLAISKWDGVLQEQFDAVEVEALGQGFVTELKG